MKKSVCSMGKLFLCAAISTFAGMLSLALSLVGMGDKGFFLALSILINAAAVIRMIYEKKHHKNMRYRISQIVYIVSVMVSAISLMGIMFTGGISDESYMLLPLAFGITVMLLVVWIVGMQYYIYRNQKQNDTKKIEFFWPGDKSRIQNLPAIFSLLGVFLIIFAIIMVFIGEVASSDTGDWAHGACYKCDGLGKYTKNGIPVTCGVCNGTGIGSYRESGTNEMLEPVLLFGVSGIGCFAMAMVLKVVSVVLKKDK